MLITKPFLLCALMRRDHGEDTVKRKHFEEWTTLCTDAALQSLILLESLAQEGFLSNLVLLDFYYALEVFQVYHAAFALRKLPAYQENAQRCAKILQAVGSAGILKQLLPEIHLQQQRARQPAQEAPPNPATDHGQISESSNRVSDELHYG